MSENLIYFEPTAHMSEGQEREQFVAVLNELGLQPQHFQACIDHNDIESVQKIRGFNSSGEQYVTDASAKKAYLYDYYVQVNVRRVNGHFDEDESKEAQETASREAMLEKLASGLRSKGKLNNKSKSIATVFFRFSHRDDEGRVLLNQEQVTIVE